VRNRLTDREIGWGSPDFGFFYQDRQSPTASMEEILTAYLDDVISDPQRNPLRTPLPVWQSFEERPVFIAFDAQAPEVASHLLPRGFLFEITEHPVSDEEVAAAEAQWRGSFDPEQHRHPLVPVPESLEPE